MPALPLVHVNSGDSVNAKDTSGQAGSKSKTDSPSGEHSMSDMDSVSGTKSPSRRDSFSEKKPTSNPEDLQDPLEQIGYHKDVIKFFKSKIQEAVLDGHTGRFDLHVIDLLREQIDWRCGQIAQLSQTSR